VPDEAPFVRPDVTTVAVFAGAFRSWHGAIHLVEAIKLLRARGRKDIGAVFVGDGPELARVRAAAEGIDSVLITGALPHQRMPAVFASADIGVAPFDLAAHAPLSLGFYWSPLKIFEYMASGLPVVAPAVSRLPALVESGREGVLYRLAPGAGDRPHAESLASAIETLSDPAVRRVYGAAARERALRDYSWSAHCRALEEAIRSAQCES
jgi:glycosyltransferase involved in cell wall biosynthesis